MTLLDIAPHLLRIYLDPGELATWPVDKIGYPKKWVSRSVPMGWDKEVHCTQSDLWPRIPDLVRELTGHRCIRCMHPFVVKKTPGEWSPCDEQCKHGLPLRFSCAGYLTVTEDHILGKTAGDLVRGFEGNPCAWIAPSEVWPVGRSPVEAQWRVLTVHHLTGVKHDCRWWNLVPLCQRCHLTIQGKVYMERTWDKPHSEWFKPYAAGWYAWRYLDLDLTRREVEIQLDHLLDLELRQDRLWREDA